MMTVQELEQAIQDMFTELYCKEYTGRLSVKETFSTFPGEEPTHLGYIVKIGLNKDEKPIEISKEGTDEEFLSFIKQELKDRSFQRTKYFTAIQIYNDEEGRQLFN
jgi:hypothetical protein